MFEFYGWVRIVEDDTDDADIRMLDVRRETLCNKLEQKIKQVEWCNGIFKLLRGVNGRDHLLMTGAANHRQESVIELLHWIAERQPYSYGLLHIRDDEDMERGFDNTFRVFSLARGNVTESTEDLLSPCVPKIEPIWSEDLLC